MMIVIKGRIYDPVVDCGHAGMNVTSCEEDGVPRDCSDIQQELLAFHGKYVKVTIEEIDA